jgi:hypothetical protein
MGIIIVIQEKNMAIKLLTINLLGALVTFSASAMEPEDKRGIITVYDGKRKPVRFKPKSAKNNDHRADLQKLVDEVDEFTSETLSDINSCNIDAFLQRRKEQFKAQNNSSSASKHVVKPAPIQMISNTHQINSPLPKARIAIQPRVVEQLPIGAVMQFDLAVKYNRPKIIKILFEKRFNELRRHPFAMDIYNGLCISRTDLQKPFDSLENWNAYQVPSTAVLRGERITKDELLTTVIALADMSLEETSMEDLLKSGGAPFKYRDQLAALSRATDK